MADVDAQARKWGDSLAVIIPNNIAKTENIEVNDTVHISIRKEHNLSHLFGKFKTKKTPMELKNESHRGWE